MKQRSNSKKLGAIERLWNKYLKTKQGRPPLTSIVVGGLAKEREYLKDIR